MTTKRIILNRSWRDHEIIGKIYCQVLRLLVDSYFPEPDKELFFKHLKSLMHKLHATKYHILNYKRVEEELHLSALKFIQDNPNEVKEAFELIFELEAFFFQIKSSLDILVKLINPIIGTKFISTNTYKNKGDSIIKGLEQLKKKKDSRSKNIDDMIHLIRHDKDHWIETTINWRDELSHYEGVKDFYFLPKLNKNNLITIEKPKFKNREVLPMMEMIFHNNLNYCQEFISMALSMRMPSCFELFRGSEEQAMKHFDNNLPYAKYAVYYWGFTTPPVEK